MLVDVDSALAVAVAVQVVPEVHEVVAMATAEDTASTILMMASTALVSTPTLIHTRLAMVRAGILNEDVVDGTTPMATVAGMEGFDKAEITNDKCRNVFRGCHHKLNSSVRRQHIHMH
jgi:hypothetical protein